MNDSAPGRAIGTDAQAAQKAAAQAWWNANRLTFNLLTDAQKESAIEAFALDMAQIQGNAVISHAPSLEEVNYDPRAGVGFDRPKPAMVVQVDGGGSFVRLLVKVGAGVHDWAAV